MCERFAINTSSLILECFLLFTPEQTFCVRPGWLQRLWLPSSCEHCPKPGLAVLLTFAQRRCARFIVHKSVWILGQLFHRIHYDPGLQAWSRIMAWVSFVQEYHLRWRVRPWCDTKGWCAEDGWSVLVSREIHDLMISNVWLMKF